MKEQLIYKDFAQYYDLIYSGKDYKKEALQLKQLIKTHKKSNGNKLLEVACGTGNHIKYLKKDFSILATDINNEILDLARKSIKGVKFQKLDMIKFNLHAEFDVILCMFSAIGYVKTYANLQKTIFNFAQHLKKGGVVIIDPWVTKQTYKVGSPHMTIHDSKDIKIARLSVSKVKGNISIQEMHHLVAERNKEVKYFIDYHELGMFDTDKVIVIMQKAGFEVKYLKSGFRKKRGLYIGVKK